jgi:hypothetical protein
MQAIPSPAITACLPSRLRNSSPALRASARAFSPSRGVFRRFFIAAVKVRRAAKLNGLLSDLPRERDTAQNARMDMPQNWRERPGRNPERELTRLKQRLGAISRRYDRAVGRRAALTRAALRARRAGKVVAIVATAMLAAWGAVVVLSPWSAAVTVRHVVAAVNCDSARLVGLAPTVRGEPGFWPRHDADRDGVACELMPAVRVVR